MKSERQRRIARQRASLRLREAEAAVKRTEREHERARRRLWRAKRAYAAARPLTQAEHEALIQRVEGGGALCCKDGLRWLKTQLPTPWVRALHGWAYERLGCRNPDHLADYVARVRALELDRSPDLDY